MLFCNLIECTSSKNEVKRSFSQRLPPQRQNSSTTSTLRQSQHEMSYLTRKYELETMNRHFLCSKDTRIPSLMQLDSIETELSSNAISLYQSESKNFSCVGLLNSLFNCYMNVILQLLFHMEQVRTTTISLLSSGVLSKPLTQFYRALTAGRPESPFKYFVSFIAEYPNYKQPEGHDAAEFLQNFIEFTFRSVDRDPFFGIFFSRLKYEMKCKNGCNESVHSTEQDALLLPIGLPADEKTELHLESSIYRYFSEQQLHEDFIFECPKCRSKKATQRAIFSKGGEYLFVILLRFEVRINAKGEAETVRRNNPVDIPPYLLSAEIPTRYNLFAIVNHANAHYVSLIRNSENSQWYIFNDKEVKIFNIAELNVTVFN